MPCKIVYEPVSNSSNLLEIEGGLVTQRAPSALCRSKKKGDDPPPPILPFSLVLQRQNFFIDFPKNIINLEFQGKLFYIYTFRVCIEKLNKN